MAGPLNEITVPAAGGADGADGAVVPNLPARPIFAVLRTQKPHIATIFLQLTLAMLRAKFNVKMNAYLRCLRESVLTSSPKKRFCTRPDPRSCR